MCETLFVNETRVLAAVQLLWYFILLILAAHQEIAIYSINQIRTSGEIHMQLI